MARLIDGYRDYSDEGLNVPRRYGGNVTLNTDFLIDGQAVMSRFLIVDLGGSAVGTITVIPFAGGSAQTVRVQAGENPIAVRRVTALGTATGVDWAV